MCAQYTVLRDRSPSSAFLLLPLCALGFALFFVPYRLTAVAARLATRQSDVFATAQVFTGAAIYGTWFALIATVVWWQLGGLAALIPIVSLPFVAAVTLIAIERESAVLDAVRAWFLLRRAHSATRDRFQGLSPRHWGSPSSRRIRLAT